MADDSAFTAAAYTWPAPLLRRRWGLTAMHCMLVINTPVTKNTNTHTNTSHCRLIIDPLVKQLFDCRLVIDPLITNAGGHQDVMWSLL